MTRIRAFGALAVVGLLGVTARAQNGPAASSPASGAGTPGGAGTAAAVGADSVNSTRWVRYKGDLQRSGRSSARISLPLNLAWRYSSDEEARGNTTTPLVTGPPSLRRIYFSTGNAVHCLEGNTGTQLWKTELTGYARAPIFLLEGGESGDLIIATTSGGTLNAMRASDGTVLWTAETRTPVGGIEPIPVQTADGIRIIQATQNGHLLAFGTDGTRDADFDIKLGRNAATPTATPTLSRDGKTLFIPAQDKNLYAVSLDERAVTWSARLGAAAYLSPVLAGDGVVCQVNNELVAVYEADGQAKWRTDLKLPILSPVSVRENGGKSTIYAGTFRGAFFAINGEEGTTDWQTDIEAPLSGTPLLLENMIVMGTRNGLLVAISPEDGKALWRFRLHTEREVTVTAPQQNDTNNTGGFQGGRGGRQPQQTVTEMRTWAIASAPAAVDGRLYVVADNATLYALSSVPLDTEPPLALKPSIIARGAEGTPQTLEITARRPVLLPGKAPITFTVEIDDPGSGIDPAGFRVTLNGNEVPKDKIIFQPATGILSAVLAEVIPQQQVVMPDGVYTVGVLARDVRGNALTFSTSFTVDKSVPAPGAARTGRGGGGRRQDQQRQEQLRQEQLRRQQEEQQEDDGPDNAPAGGQQDDGMDE